MDNLTRFDVVQNLASSYDVLPVFWTRVKRSKELDNAHFQLCLNNCENAAAILCDELEHCLGYMLTSEQYDEFCHRLELAINHIEVVGIFSGDDDLQNWQDFENDIDSRSSSWDDMYSMYRNEY